MKKIVFLTALCLAVVSWQSAGKCDDLGEDIMRSEAMTEEEVSEEIEEADAQSREEMDEMELSMDTGGHTN